MNEVALASRNLLRNPRRTSIALGTLAFGVVAMLLAGGFIEWVFWAMRESTIQSRLGHIQVVRSGYFQAGAADPFSHMLGDGMREEEQIRQTPHVIAIAPRLHFGGLVSHGDNTISFLGEGVDAGVEKSVSKHLSIVAGVDLHPSDRSGAILGSGLARNLGAEVGESIVLLAVTPSGGINATEVVIRGLFFTSTKSFDDTVLRIPIATARQLMRIEGSHTWVLLLDETENTPHVLGALRDQFPEHTTDLQFVPWTELADFYSKTVRLFSRQMLVVHLIIVSIIILAISNVAVMNVLERQAEIGTLRAIGLRQGKILQQFLAEGMLLGVIGGSAGTLVGWGMAQVISAIGIPMPPPPGMDVGFQAEVLVTYRLAAQGLMVSVCSAVLATLYPAWKASRLQIVDALRRSR
jgi:putative ABC transport system permease protein